MASLKGALTVAGAVSAKKRRRSSRTPSNGMPVGSYYGNQAVSASPVRCDSDQLGILAGYAFMAWSNDPERKGWRYVHIEYSNCVSTSSRPIFVWPQVNDEIRDFWKKATIDGAYYCDNSHVDMRSLKLVYVQLNSREATHELFTDRGDQSQSSRFAALSKLTDEEARLLGLDKPHTLMKLFRDQDAHRDASKLSESLREDHMELTIGYPEKK